MLVDLNALGLLIENLQKQEETIIALAEEETAYAESDLKILFEDAVRFVQMLPQIMTMHETLCAKETEILNSFASQCQVRLEAWGKCLLTIPANAPLPLAIILPLAFRLSGNTVIVASASKVKETARHCVSVLQEIFDGISFYEEGTRHAVEALVEKGCIDALYFTGSSKLMSNLAERCARKNIHLVFEGEGNGLCFIAQQTDKAVLSKAALDIVESCRFGLGRMCSKPTTVFVPAQDMTYFSDHLKHALQNAQLSLSVDKAFDDATIKRLEEAQRANRLNQEFGLIFDANRPFIVVTDEQDENIWQEVYGPGLFIVPYMHPETVFQYIERHPYRLQVSVYGGSDNQFKHYARQCHNKLPIAQDSLLPWGCYGGSGISDPQDFYRKGLKRVIYEYSSIP